MCQGRWGQNCGGEKKGYEDLSLQAFCATSVYTVFPKSSKYSTPRAMSDDLTTEECSENSMLSASSNFLHACTTSDTLWSSSNLCEACSPFFAIASSAAVIWLLVFSHLVWATAHTDQAFCLGTNPSWKCTQPFKPGFAVTAQHYHVSWLPYLAWAVGYGSNQLRGNMLALLFEVASHQDQTWLTQSPPHWQGQGLPQGKRHPTVQTNPHHDLV